MTSVVGIYNTNTNKPFKRFRILDGNIPRLKSWAETKNIMTKNLRKIKTIR